MRRAGSASPAATSAARTRSRASDTALSGSPTTLNAGNPGATCTWTSTARASMPSNATVATRWTILLDRAHPCRMLQGTRPRRQPQERFMNKMRPSAYLLVAMLLIPIRSAHADGLQAGQWATVQRAQIDGVAGPPQQGSRCLTEEAVADLDKTFSPISRTTNTNCERVEHESTPQRLKWRLQCTGQIDIELTGEFIFDKPEHYTATITARSFMLGRLMQRSEEHTSELQSLRHLVCR